MIHVILLGPPGSGKGTQADKIVKNYNFYHISSGEIFRKNIIENTFLGKKAQYYVNSGILVPDIITCKMLEIEIKKNIHCNGLIYDGYPRTVKQANILNNFFTKKLNNGLKLVLFFDIKDDFIIKRLFIRKKFSKRLDDSNIYIIKNRIKEYHMKTKPLIDFYKKNHFYFFIKINAEKSVTEITKYIYFLIDKKLNQFK